MRDSIRIYYQFADILYINESRVIGIVKSPHGIAAQTAYASLKKTLNIDGTIVGFRGIEAISDDFGFVLN